MIEKDGNLLTELRLIHVTGVSLIGNVQITTQALHAVLQAGVDISFFSGSGRYLSHMAPEQSKNIFLRLGQYRWNGLGYDYESDLECLEKYQKVLCRKETVNALMGVEGICSAVYFRAYAI